MEQENRKITLIVPAEMTDTFVNKDREGGETHGLKETVKGWFTVDTSIDLDQARSSLEECMKDVHDMLKDLKQDAISGWELDKLSVSLAVSAEGSIGIATAGVETSIELGFSRIKPSGG